jgi:hypothetical protein
MKIYLPLLTLCFFFISCTTAYKSGQTPDDVYFSPERPVDEYFRVEKRTDESRYNKNENLQPRMV